jgi:hypothetical protein
MKTTSSILTMQSGLHSQYMVCKTVIKSSLFHIQVQVPNDPDPQRAAILATIPSFMVMAYNRLIEVGQHRDAPR